MLWLIKGRTQPMGEWMRKLDSNSSLASHPGPLQLWESE
jgi:hypothetical protein